jgi:hypothetical protein
VAERRGKKSQPRLEDSSKEKSQAALVSQTTETRQGVGLEKDIHIFIGVYISLMLASLAQPFSVRLHP